MRKHAAEMARTIEAKIKREADRMDALAATEKHAGEQRTMMATVRGLRIAEKIAGDFCL